MSASRRLSGVWTASFPGAVQVGEAGLGKQRLPLAPNAKADVIPFPIGFQRRLLEDLYQQASAAREPAIVERCLRAAVRRHGEILADKGIAPERIESEMRSMAVLLTGNDFYERDGKAKAKPRRRTKGELTRPSERQSAGCGR